jgi:hypothetical protein
MKTVPLRPSRLPDSGGIFTFSNGVRMKEISRSVRQAKQAKFLDADCTCPYSPYSPYGDVAGPYRSYGGDVADIGWSILGESDVDTCHWVAYNRRTRGPIQGCHVSLIGWPRNSIYKMLEAAGFDPHTSPPHNTLTNSNDQLSRRCSLL